MERVRQTGVGPLVSSQDRKVAVVPKRHKIVYRLSTAGFIPPSIPGHALHEKGLQRQLGVGTLVSGQERRAAVVPRINRGSTANFVPPLVYIGFPLFVLPKTRPGGYSSSV